MSSEVTKDMRCSVPSDAQEEPEPVVAATAASAAMEFGDSPKEVPHIKRKSPVCGYCKQEGHRNQVRNGVPLCPEQKADFMSE